VQLMIEAVDAEFNLNLVEGFNKWLTIQHYSPSTRINYCTDVRGLAYFTGQVSLLELKRDHVVEYLWYLQEYRHLARASLARMIFSLRKFYKFLDLGEVVPGDAILTISAPKVPTRLPQALSKSQIEQLLAAANTPRDLAVLELFYALGVRRAELRALDCEDLHFDADGKGGSALVRCGKGGKQRVTIFGSYAAGALRAYLKGRTTGPLILAERYSQEGSVVFHECRHKDREAYWTGWWAEWKPLPNGKWKRARHRKYLGRHRELPTLESAKAVLLRFIETQPSAKHPGSSARRLGIKAIERIVKKAARRAGLGDLRPHQLRHSFATHLLNGGANLVYIAELLGHTSVVATQRYLHVATAELIRTHSKFHPSGGNDDQTETRD
jgi:site-specific recombinase XerD